MALPDTGELKAAIMVQTEKIEGLEKEVKEVRSIAEKNRATLTENGLIERLAVLEVVMEKLTEKVDLVMTWIYRLVGLVLAAVIVAILNLILN